MSKNIYLTRDEAAEKARRKAVKAKMRAQAAEEAAAQTRAQLKLGRSSNSGAAQTRAQLNKRADTNLMTVAKSLAGGLPTRFTKRHFYLELQKRADQIRESGETREAAFSRYATTDPEGRLLFHAHKSAAGEDYSGELDDVDDAPDTNDGYRRLMELTSEKQRKGETVEQAFARLYADPRYRDLVAAEKRMHTERIAKALEIG